MERIDEHPLLDLIGKFGRPNKHQDSLEFLEKHFINFVIAGNVYWFWDDPVNGVPSTVRQLEPENMRIVPGRNKTIARYEYWHQGQIAKFHPEQITHFKRANPFSRYYGMSALQVLRWTAIADNHMLNWNNEFLLEVIHLRLLQHLYY